MEYKYVKMTKHNVKRLEKIYGDAAWDTTATFQVPINFLD